MVSVDPDLTFAEGHELAHHAEQRLAAALPKLSSSVIHAHPGAVGVPVRES